jgi:hypothetical protein
LRGAVGGFRRSGGAAHLDGRAPVRERGVRPVAGGLRGAVSWSEAPASAGERRRDGDRPAGPVLHVARLPRGAAGRTSEQLAGSPGAGGPLSPPPCASRAAGPAGAGNTIEA